MLPAIKTEGLTKVYSGGKVKALDNLNLEVPSKTIFGFLGPNAAGKTTTIKLLLGLISPTSGTASVLGKEIGNTEMKHCLGFLPESPYFYEYLTADEFLNFYAKIFRLTREERRRGVNRLLKLVGLEESRTVSLRKFSRGMLQRIGIAQSLINNPDLVFLDEPITGLDPLGRKEIRELILHIKEEGRTVFFCSHVLHDVELMCDWVGILCRGKLIRVGKMEELLQAREIEISAEGVDSEGCSILEKKAKRITKENGRVILFIDDEGSIPEIEEVIRAHHGKHLAVVPHKESLEELFLKEIKTKEGQE